MENMDQCRTKCDASNVECNCGVLKDCVNELSDYDMAVLAVKGYIVTDEDEKDYASLSSSVDLFAASSNFLKDNIEAIRELAKKNVAKNPDVCRDLLSRFTSPCEPGSNCDSRNTQVSFIGPKEDSYFDSTDLLTLDPPRLDVSKLDRQCLCRYVHRL